jgi:hypothetical protein
MLLASCALGVTMALGGCAGQPVPGSGNGELSEAKINEAERVELSPKTAIRNYRQTDSAVAANAALLYLTAFASGQGEAVDADPIGSPIMRTLEIASLGAYAFDKSLMLEPPWMVFLSMGVHTTEETAKFGYRGGKEFLGKPSLMLVGIEDADGAVLGTPAYGAKLDALFAKGDALMRSAPFGCEPSVKWKHTTTLRGELISTDGASTWHPNVLRSRGYTCLKGLKDDPGNKARNLVFAYPSPKATPSIEKEFGMVALTGTVTAQDDPFVRVNFPDLTRYPDLGGNLAAWTLLEQLQDEIPVGWYFVLSGAMPGDPGGALQVVVGQKTKDGFRMARYGEA